MTHRLLSVCCLSIVLAGCDLDWADSSSRFTEPFSYNYTLKPGGRLSIENMNGSVEIAGWDRDTVEITGTKYAATEEMLQAMKIDIQHSPDAVRIRTVPPSGRRGNMGAKYIIRVPRKVELERIQSSNAHVETRDIDGPARIRTSNGSVRSFNTKGVLEIETSNASIEVSDHAGAITGLTSNGRVQVDLSNPEQGKPIRLESSNGGVTLKLRALNGNNVRISTSNAGINVALPDGAGAQLRANTSNGSIRSDLPVQGTVAKNHADGRIGSGGPYVELSTSNGSINLERL